MSKCFHCDGTLTGSYYEVEVRVVGATHSEKDRVKVHEGDCLAFLKRSGVRSGDHRRYTVVSEEFVETDAEWTPELRDK